MLTNDVITKDIIDKIKSKMKFFSNKKKIQRTRGDRLIKEKLNEKNEETYNID